ncbi:hypothetical protein Droror1_Dr00002019 [Drosera rotundifolia]
MDSPDNTNSAAAAASVTKIEDSPVFNYISSLSPIKTVSALHNGQSFPLLSFSSPESLRSSPGIRSSNNLKSTLSVSEALVPGSFLHGKEGSKSEVIPDSNQPLHERAKVIDSVRPVLELAATNDCSDVAVHSPQFFNDIFCTPSGQGDNLKSSPAVPMKATDISAAGIIQVNPEYTRFSAEARQEAHNIEPWQGKVATNQDSVEWICETAEQYLCATPVKEEPPIDCVTAAEAVDASVKGKADEDQRSESFQSASLSKNNICSDREGECYSSVEGDNRHCSQQPQLMPRRSLVFEISGSGYRKLVSDSSDSASTGGQPASAQAGPCSMPWRGQFSSPFPGIGLHLNTLRVTPSDEVIVKHEPVASKRKTIRKPSTLSSSKPIAEKAFAEAVSGESQELSQDAPRKRRRSKTTGETEGCKRCNCKRSKCLKLYCECFAAGLFCVEPCSCQGCFNQPAYEQTVMNTRKQIESRNPLAFAPKVIKISDSQEIEGEVNKTPASARHKRGCNCKKSHCLKKYCECFQGGVGCSINCRCEGCKNSFGCKDWTDNVILEETRQETKPVGENLMEMSVQDKKTPKVEDVEEQHDIHEKLNPQADRSATYFLSCFTGISIEPPSFDRRASTLQPCLSKKSEKSDCVSYQLRFGTKLQMIRGDKTQGASTGDSSQLNGVSSMSPNSPPYRESGNGSTLRSSRKLFLKSIPPFPVLSPDKNAGLQG